MKDDDMWFSESAGERFFDYSADDDELCLWPSDARLAYGFLKNKRQEKKERKTNAKLRLLLVVDVICETERRETARQARCRLAPQKKFWGVLLFF